ncbi:MAG: response regulator [Bacteroidia bacterium]|nr:response regulator [Bacteroidia bacterium]
MKKLITLTYGLAAILFLNLLFSLNVLAVKFYSVNSLFGISMRETNSVCKDDNGFVWASSKTGILRLSKDNYHIYRLPYESTDVIRVRLIYKNLKLFAYTNNGQVFCYNPVFDKFELILNLRKHIDDINIILFDLLIDDNGICWIATSLGLYKYQSGKLSPAFEFSSNRYAINWYDSKNIIVAKQDGIWLFDINSLEKKHIYENGNLNSFDFFTLYFDKDQNKLWLGTVSEGLFFYNFRNGTCSNQLKSVLPKQPILSIEENSDSTCLIGFDGQGIWELDRRNQKVLNIYKESLDNPSSLRGNGVYDLFCDNNSRVWVCTYSGGLSFFDQASPLVNQIVHLSNNTNSLINNDVNSIIEDHRGKLWFATNNGISCWDLTTNKWSSFYNDKETQAQVFLSLCEDNQGRIWAGTYSSGVYLFDGRTGKELAHYSKNGKGSPLLNDFIFNIYKDSSGDIWLGGGSGSVVCYLSRENKFRAYSNEPIGCFAELSDNQILLGCSYGLSQLNKQTGDIRRLVEGLLVRDILVMGDDVWICTSGDGLIRYNYKTGKTEKFTAQMGLPSNFINSIISANDYLWLGTENGLCRFDPKNKNALTYSSIYSLSRTSFNNCSHAILKNGQIAWGTNNGAVIFAPNLVDESSTKGKIFFQDLTVAGRSIRDIPSFNLTTPIDSLQEINLKYFQNTISLELLSLGQTPGSKFSWEMEGFDQQWSQPTGNNVINYTNIPSGHFILKIKLFDSSLSNVLAERSIAIKLVPPFWRTGWFWVIIIMVLSIIIFLYLLYYINRLKQEHTEEKVRFFTNTAHDIRTSLTLIKAPVEELSKEKNLTESGKYYLNLAIEQARQLTSVVTQLMDFQKVDVGKEHLLLSMTDIVKLVSNRRIMLASFAKSKNIELVFVPDRESYMTAVDESKMEKIIDNLISNAIKYSHNNSQIRIDLRCDDKKWMLQVKDNGIGISKKAQRQLFKEFYRGDNAINSKVVGSGIGLLLVKNYVAIHGGNISCTSQENVGSTFQIVIPFKSISWKSVVSNVTSDTPAASSYIEDVSQQTDSETEIQTSKEMKVLVVEDNDDLLNFMKSTLSNEFKVFTAVDGEKAWEFISKQIPDLVVSDIMMPNMDGFELCKIMKSTYETSHIPIVLLTALSEKTNQLHGLGLGADDYLTKPFDMNLLIQRIKSIVRNREVVRGKALKLIKGDSNEPILTNELNDKFVRKMLEVAKANISNAEFDKEEFASSMNVSSSLLYKKIKSLTDQSPTDFIKTIRLHHAVELLQSRNYTVTEVSELCGFASLGYFSTVFSKHYGKSPSEYLSN